MSKKSLIVFTGISFGIPVLLGILMGIAFGKGQSVMIFPQTWMFLPAAGAMAARLTEKDSEEYQNIPKGFYIFYLIFTLLMLVVTALDVFLPSVGFYAISQFILMPACIVGIIWMAVMKKERRETAGLRLMKNAGKSLLGIVIFLGLYALIMLLGTLPALLTGGSLEGLAINPQAPLMLINLVIVMFIAYFMYFGEEYGWRYYLQPILQKKFGMKKGIIILGLIWGIWHLPINMFFYSPETWVQSVITQLAACIGFSIFFGWVYLRTGNIWAVVVIHLLNNNIPAVLWGVDGSGKVFTWADTIITVVIYLLVFVPFLFTKTFREEKKG